MPIANDKEGYREPPHHCTSSDCIHTPYERAALRAGWWRNSESRWIRNANIETESYRDEGELCDLEDLEVWWQPEEVTDHMKEAALRHRIKQTAFAAGDYKQAPLMAIAYQLRRIADHLGAPE